MAGKAKGHGKDKSKKPTQSKPRRLNFGAQQAEEKFGAAVGIQTPKLIHWKKKIRQARENGRRVERIRAERMHHMIHAQLLGARKELLEFALRVKFPGGVEELRKAGVVSKKQAKAELGQIKLDLKNTGRIVKRLIVQERHGLPLIDPNPNPRVRLANYDKLLAEVDVDLKKQGAVVTTARRMGAPGKLVQAQREELELKGRQSIARLEMLGFLRGHTKLRKARGFRTKGDVMKEIDAETRKLTLVSDALRMMERN